MASGPPARAGLYGSDARVEGLFSCGAKGPFEA